MKALVITLLTAIQAIALAQPPTDVAWPLQKGYIPVGFDDNDRVQLMVQGTFPSTCFKVGPYKIDVNDGNQTISVEQHAYQYEGVCLAVQVPFAQVIDVGIARAGEYTLIDATSGKQMGKLGVAYSKNPGPDDFLYAPVQDAYVKYDEQSKENDLIINGQFTNRCTRLKQVDVSYHDSVIVVQPIAEYFSPSRDCGKELIRYQHRVRLTKGIQGDYMLHVRSMNGQAINKIIELR